MAEEEESFKRKVTKAGMSANALTAEEKKPFVEATAEVYPQFSGQGESFQSYEALIAEYPDNYGAMKNLSQEQEHELLNLAANLFLDFVKEGHWNNYPEMMRAGVAKAAGASCCSSAARRCGSPSAQRTFSSGVLWLLSRALSTALAVDRKSVV